MGSGGPERLANLLKVTQLCQSPGDPGHLIPKLTLPCPWSAAALGGSSMLGFLWELGEETWGVAGFWPWV